MEKRKKKHFVDLIKDSAFYKNYLVKSQLTGTFYASIRKNEPAAVPILAKEFNENELYQGLSQSVRIAEDEKNGRFLEAIEDIPMKAKVAEDRAYAFVIDQTRYKYCLTCLGEVESNGQQCNDCKLKLFCSPECRSENKTHKYECKTLYHSIVFGNEIVIKLAIQMVFVALAIYNDNVRELKEDVERIFPSNKNEMCHNKKIPESLRKTDLKEKFRCIMHLESKPYDEQGRQWIDALNVIMQLPEIVRLFPTGDDNNNTVNYRVFLQHLLAYNLGLAMSNCFDAEVSDRPFPVHSCRIYTTISFMNHSCTPNVLQCIIGDKMTCIASSHIAADTQLCIDYRCFSEYIPTVERRKVLEEAWGFECLCDRCKSEEEIEESDIENACELSLNELYKELGKEAPWTIERGAQIIAYQRHIAELFPFKGEKMEEPGEDVSSTSSA